jgi:putative endonuclease
MGYRVYILYSPKFDKYYIGQSSHPQRRLSFHNTIEKGFTSRYRPWELVYMKEYGTRQEAKSIEQKIKSWKSKIRIKELISGRIVV